MKTPGQCSVLIKTARFFVAVFFMVLSSQSFAQLNLQDEVKACALVAEDKPRLSCYDKLGQLVTHSDQTAVLLKAEPVVFDPVTVENNHPESQPDKNSKEGVGIKYLNKSKSAESSTYDFALVSMAKNSKGTWEFQFENGQIWKQLEAKYVSKPKTYPAAVQIYKGSFGSYKLRIMPKGIAIKARRIK